MARVPVVATWAALALCVAFLVPAAGAQPRQTGTLIVTVIDQSQLVVPGATVSVVGLDDGTRKSVVLPLKSNEKGVATFTGLPLGRYSVSGEFPGFEIGVIGELRLKRGENKQVLVLRLARVAEEVTVGRDPQTTASDRGSTFGTAMTREQIEALSDDPDEMARQLRDMAGTGATMRVDSFEGAELPQKSQIKAIHITRDSFAAENHTAGGMFIDIITQPGVRPLAGNARTSFYDSVLDGQNPLVPKKGPARTQSYGINIGGTLIKERSSFNLGINGSDSYRSPNLYAATLAGTRAENLNMRVPTDNLGINGSIDYALTRDQTLRLAFTRYVSSSRNLGVGAYDLPDRAYSTRNSNFTLRVQEAGPLGRRFFINTRFMTNWANTSASSAVEAPTVTVLDAFTGGGAQRAGGRRTRVYDLQSDLDYVRGRHSWRAGIALNGGTYRSDDTANYLGTYTFASLEAYEAGLPRTFTRRIGDALISYENWQAAVYLQNDIRVSKNLTLSPGVRVEAQTHVNDRNNIGPRFGITWAPFKGGKTTLRASAGRFYDWLNAGTHEQTLRVDGFHQQELNIVNPTYPEPGQLGVIPPTNRYLLDEGLQLASNTRLSAGIDQQFTKQARLSVVYAVTRADGVLVGENLNAPVDGVRPNPALANVIRSVSAGRSRSETLSSNLTISRSGPMMGPMTSTGPRLDWKRGLTLNVGYTLGKWENNVDGAFSVPASGSLASEWGPAANDARHRLTVGLTSAAVKNLTAMVYVYGSSGTPYTVRTGSDENGDLLFNDRPSGVGRNTERTAGQWNSFGMFSYTIGFGKKKLPGGTGITGISFGPGGASITQGTYAAMPRYRVSISLNVQNLTNRANYMGYSGIMTSPFFRKPTMVEGVRTMNMAVSLSF